MTVIETAYFLQKSSWELSDCRDYVTCLTSFNTHPCLFEVVVFKRNEYIYALNDDMVQNVL